MGKKQSQQAAPGAGSNNLPPPAPLFEANPADMRAAWRAALAAEPKPRRTVWPLLWGVLGGLITTVALGALVLFVPPLRDAVADRLLTTPAPIVEPTEPVASAPILAFEDPSPLVLMPNGIMSSPTSVVVIVRDIRDKPAQGVEVTFSLQVGEGDPKITLETPRAITDSNGRATAKLRPGNTSGKAVLVAEASNKRTSRSIEVRSPQVSPTSTTPATVPPAPVVASLKFEPPSIDLGQTTSLIQITVLALAQDGSGVAGQTIALAVEGSGTVNPGRVTTGSDGTAQFAYTPAQLAQVGAITAECGQVISRLALILGEPQVGAVQITFDPAALDDGVKQSRAFTVRVVTLDGEVPITQTQVTLRVEPAVLATLTGQGNITNQGTYTGITDINGELVAGVALGAAVGEGKLVAALADGTQAEALITVRPVAWNKSSPNAILYRFPVAKQENTIREAAKDERFPIVGRTTIQNQIWYQVRLPDSTTAWTQAASTNVQTEGVVTGVPEFTSSEVLPTPTAMPTATHAPTQMPAPLTPTPSSVVTSPTPAGAPADYPTLGKHEVTAASGQMATLYRQDDATVQLAELPAGGSVEVMAPPAGQAIPAGYVWAKVQFWVKKERVGSVSLSVSGGSDYACWDVKQDQFKPADGSCGSLFPVTSIYNAGAGSLPQRGDWRQVTVQVWMSQDNILP